MGIEAWQMKILWIVNSPLGLIGRTLYGRDENGLWMSALLEEFKNHNKYQLVIATTAAVRETFRGEEDGVVYYALPNQVPLLYDENNAQNQLAWKTMLDAEKPDVIQVWGTEFTHGLCAQRVAGNIPSVIYMQGYLGSIARHYLAGMTQKELRKSVTLRDVLKRDSIVQQQKKYLRSTQKEAEMFRLAGRIISENDWCNSSICAIVPDIQVYSCPLSVNQTFSKAKWSMESAEPHSIICTASGYPLKGLHMVLRAVALLKKAYPDIRLYVPGQKMVSDDSVQWRLRKRGYTKYIEQLIKELGIEKQIVWLGRLSQEQLAEQYSRTSVFVLSSSIENHSSSLKEAMMVGVPSVASAVGGIPEYVRHGENGFLYRFEEYEIMAGYIKRLFDDKVLAVKLSEAARRDMIRLHSGTDVYETMSDIYKQILEEKR
jgi:glycosyltransferase involved in cell wall biosynthesis